MAGKMFIWCLANADWGPIQPSGQVDPEYLVGFCRASGRFNICSYESPCLSRENNKLVCPPQKGIKPSVSLQVSHLRVSIATYVAAWSEYIAAGAQTSHSTEKCHLQIDFAKGKTPKRRQNPQRQRDLDAVRSTLQRASQRK